MIYKNLLDNTPGKKNQGFRREVMALAVDERFTLNTYVKNRNNIIEDWFDGQKKQKLYIQIQAFQI